jgi:Heterokaryon incompatibility protein (HET)
MRLLKLDSHGELSLTKDFGDDIPRYAILSHTWNEDNDKEVIFSDIENKYGKSKAGYRKLQFCSKQAEKDDLEYFWVDTCCINKADHVELSEAITSMFRWYRDAVKCYVYLSDVSARKRDYNGQTERTWEASFRTSRWFKRGWTLQELIAPASVEFFSREGKYLGDKKSLEGRIHEITQIPIAALRGTPLTDFSVDERKRWAVERETKKKEDKAYCLLGIFNVFIPLIYGEGDHAFTRLKEEIEKRSGKKSIAAVMPETGLTPPGSSAPPAHVHWMVTRHANPLFTGRKDLLQEIDSIIRNATKDFSSQTQCRVVLSGMGGQGKSEICLQLAHSLRHM